MAALPSIQQRPATAPARGSQVTRGDGSEQPIYRPASRDGFRGAGLALRGDPTISSRRRSTASDSPPPPPSHGP